MAVLTTTGSIGNREDLIPIITMISPNDTPFLSSLQTKKSTGTKHEWLTDALGTPITNAAVEGSAANPTAATLATRTRVSNTIQNIRKVGSVSDNQEAVLKAGIKSEYSYQLEKATKGIALDTERALIQSAEGQGSVAVNSVPAYGSTMGGLFSFLQTNLTSATPTGVPAAAVGVALAAQPAILPAVQNATIKFAVAPALAPAVNDYVFINTGVGRGQYRLVVSYVVGTLTATVAGAWDVIPTALSTVIVFKSAALTDIMFNNSFEKCYIQGGNPDCVFAHPTQKRAISNLDKANRRLTSTEKKVTNSIDIYESDFGVHTVKTNRWLPVGSLAVIDKSQFAAAYLRPVKAEQLARVGSSRDFMIESAVTLEARAENSSALILGLL